MSSTSSTTAIASSSSSSSITATVSSTTSSSLSFSFSPFILPPPSTENGTGILHSAVPIPTSWPSIPPGLVSAGVDPQNAGAPSPIDAPLPTPAQASSPIPPDGTDPDTGDPGSPSSPIVSSYLSSSSSVGSTAGLSPNRNVPAGGDPSTTTLGLTAASTPVEDAPQSTNTADRVHIHTRRRAVAALVVLWLLGT